MFTIQPLPEQRSCRWCRQPFERDQVVLVVWPSNTRDGSAELVMCRPCLKQAAEKLLEQAKAVELKAAKAKVAELEG